MDMMQLIKTRKSVRTFDGKPISVEIIEKLDHYIKNIPNPYGIPVDFVLLDAKKNDLSSPVIQGETLYIAGKVEKQPHGEEAFGYSFEKMVLYAWSLGIGTTWIGGTLDRPHFEKTVGLKDRERMYGISPLGYPAEEMSEVDIRLRGSVKGDERLPASELFFNRTLSTPLALDDPNLQEILESVRWAPSAANMQPWRIIRNGNQFHFYEKHTRHYDAETYGDVQKIDMGIALCHFMSVTEGMFSFSDPGIVIGPDMEYIATVTL